MKKNRVLLLCLLAVVCVAFVVLIGVRTGLFGGEDDGGGITIESGNNERDDESVGSDADTAENGDKQDGGNTSGTQNTTESAPQKAKPLEINAKAAYFADAFGYVYYIEDAAELEKLKTLMAPLPDVKRAPQSEPNYNLSFDCGDEFVAMEVYIEDDVVFADSGEGPFVVAGSPAEIKAFLK